VILSEAATAWGAIQELTITGELTISILMPDHGDPFYLYQAEVRSHRRGGSVSCRGPELPTVLRQLAEATRKQLPRVWPPPQEAELLELRAIIEQQCEQRAITCSQCEEVWLPESERKGSISLGVCTRCGARYPWAPT
jgi:hypothetical protein